MLSHSVVSNSLGLHGLRPTSLFCPWDSPDKNNGMGCRALLQGIFATKGRTRVSHPLHWQAGSLPQAPPRKPSSFFKSEVAQSCPTLGDPMDTRLLRPWNFLGKSTGVGCRFLLQGTSQPRDRTQVSHMWEAFKGLQLIQ